ADEIREVARLVRQLGLAVPEWLAAAMPGEPQDALVGKVLKWAEAERSGRLISLEYPPSYDMRPRWGGKVPPHAGLTELFDRDSSGVPGVSRNMVELTPYFRRIKTDFSHETPGEPAWYGGAMNAVDLASIYHFLTTARSRTYLEIGSGLSTLFAARAK